MAEAENASSRDYRYAQKGSSAFHSEIYGAGSEYALCSAEAQLLSAIVGVLNESLAESLKGFYKLRKAYITLDAIAQAEERYMESHRKSDASQSRQETNLSQASTTSNSGSRVNDASSKEIQTSQPDTIEYFDGEHGKSASKTEDWDSDEDAFEEAQESLQRTATPNQYAGHVEIGVMAQRVDSLSLSLPSSPNGAHKTITRSFTDEKPLAPKIGRTLTYDPDSEVFAHSIDIFIHSGTNVFFGLLQLLLSMIPPAFARLLSIIGFQGDRQRGLRLLWQATKFTNVHGALAGLALLNYYNSFVGFNDIFPDQTKTSSDLSTGESIHSHPIRRLEKLLHEMRSRYPRSGLWLLEDARMHASKRDLDTSISMLGGVLSNKLSKTELKQVRALQQFELALQAMYSHQYALCTAGFEECCRLNSWSHALYLYIAGTAQLELYRAAKSVGDAVAAAEHAARVEDLLQRSRSQVGKRTFMARQLPFDGFVARKMQKWEARGAALGVSTIDAVGISPLVEIVYFWNGFKKMAPKHVELTLAALDRSEAHLKHIQCDDADELASLAVLRAASLRTAGNYTEATALLKAEVVPRERLLNKGGFKDNWPPPIAHYELAANMWAWKNEEGAADEDKRRRVSEAQEWLERASKSESYELEARMGMRITTGLSTVKTWMQDHESSQ